MTKYPYDKDKQLLKTAGTFAKNSTMTRQLLDLIERREAKNQKMQAMLEFWLRKFPYPTDAGRGSWETWDQQKVIDDTKTLLKEAEEVKDE